MPVSNRMRQLPIDVPVVHEYGPDLPTTSFGVRRRSRLLHRRVRVSHAVAETVLSIHLAVRATKSKHLLPIAQYTLVVHHDSQNYARDVVDTPCPPTRSPARPTFNAHTPQRLYARYMLITP
ncbi:hypothetical protein VTO73DRAFT_7018 [Trametes versicolor]